MVSKIYISFQYVTKSFLLAAALMGTACSVHIDEVNAEGTVNQSFEGENIGAQDDSNASSHDDVLRRDKRDLIESESKKPSKVTSDARDLKDLNLRIHGNFSSLQGKTCKVEVQESLDYKGSKVATLFSSEFQFTKSFDFLDIAFKGKIGSIVRVVFRDIAESAVCSGLQSGWVSASSSDFEASLDKKSDSGIDDASSVISDDKHKDSNDEPQVPVQSPAVVVDAH